MIGHEEISFVVQGAFTDPARTAEALRSIRLHFPGSELILSTWEGTETAGLEFDELVLSADPGPIEAERPIKRNINRLITNTSAGLARATRPYAVKSRHDVIFRSGAMTREIGLHCLDAHPDSLFERKILQSHIQIGYPFQQCFFHCSDTVLGGSTDDLRKFFNVPHATSAEMVGLVSEQYLLTRNLAEQDAAWIIPKLHPTAPITISKADYLALGRRSGETIAKSSHTLPAPTLGLDFTERLKYQLSPDAEKALATLKDPAEVALSPEYSEESLMRNWRLESGVARIAKARGSLRKPLLKLRMSTLKRLGKARSPHTMTL